jgi:hypothetical protein
MRADDARGSSPGQGCANSGVSTKLLAVKIELTHPWPHEYHAKHEGAADEVIE